MVYCSFFLVIFIKIFSNINILKSINIFLVNNNIMRFIIKIQRNRVFNLPSKIKKYIKSKELNRILWILEYNNNSISINFIKNVETPQDNISEDTVKLTRNVNNYSLIKIPNIIYNYLNCKTFDYIVLEVKNNTIHIYRQERIELSEISGLIKESGGES